MSRNTLAAPLGRQKEEGERKAGEGKGGREGGQAGEKAGRGQENGRQ